MLIEYALRYQAKDFRISDGNVVEPPTLDAPLISQHLRTIDLYQVYLQSPTLNFSRCLAFRTPKDTTLQHWCTHDIFQITLVFAHHLILYLLFEVPRSDFCIGSYLAAI